MKFRDLPKSHYFVVIDPQTSTQLLAKDSNGQVRTWDGWRLFEGSIDSDAEVQPVHIKKE